MAGFGLVLLAGALIWSLIAQVQMGDSRRIGIDEKTSSPLDQYGLFGISRNPIFLGKPTSSIGLMFTDGFNL